MPYSPDGCFDVRGMQCIDTVSFVLTSLAAVRASATLIPLHLLAGEGAP